MASDALATNVVADPKMQAAYDHLVEHFILPVVEGGQIEIGRPIAPGCAAFFAATVPSSEDARLRVFTALIDAADEIHDVETVPWPSGPLTWIAAAAHDLCALTDPALDRVFVRGARETILRWTDRWLELVPPPLTRGDALARHALVAPILSIERTDRTLKTWAYTYRFFGRQVDLITLNKVAPIETRVPLATLLESTRGMELMPRRTALLSRSPVTELLWSTEVPGFRFSIASLTVLADVGLRSGIAKQLARKNGVGDVIGKAIRAPELAAHPELLRVALAFALELHMVQAIDGGDRERSSPLSTARSEDGIFFDALLCASFEDEHAVDTLRQLDDGDRALLQARVEAVRRRVTEAAAQEAHRLHATASR